MKDEGRTGQEKNDNLVDFKYSIQDLVNLEQLRNIFEKFTESTGFTIGFLDHPGLNILIATGWRDICTKFHRACPASIKNCKKSNTHLLEQLKELGQIVIEECDNGLVDCATPIVIKGKHIASLATGQLLLKQPDIKRFKRQASMFGYDEQKYLEAIKDIPVVSEEKLKSVTSFLGEIAAVISELGYTNLVLKEEAVLLDKEITERKKAEEALKARGEELESKTQNLEEANIALKVLLKRRDEDKAELENRILLNMKALATPYLEKLKMTVLDENQKTYISILESNLNDIVSPFSHKLSSMFLDFTPTEIQVANLLRQGKTNKEIGGLFNCSPRTIAFHRDNIRRKLGLKNKKTNLKSYLLTLQK